LLRWTHYGPGDVNTDSAAYGVASNGSSGFTAPLGAGNYSVWIQDFNSGQFPYAFRFGVQAAVPEPGSIALLVGVSAMGALMRRHRK